MTEDGKIKKDNQKLKKNKVIQGRKCNNSALRDHSVDNNYTLQNKHGLLIVNFRIYL